MEQPSPLEPWWRRWFGHRSERAACRFLRRRGHKILKINWHGRTGEVDLVAYEGRTIVFVEVRSTEGASTEKPALSVDEEKQRRLSRLAAEFMQKHRLLGYAARFDVILIAWPKTRWFPEIEHVPNAFPAQGHFGSFG